MATGGIVNFYFVVRNWAGTQTGNPAGLLYRIDITYDRPNADGDEICDREEDYDGDTVLNYQDFCPMTKTDDNMDYFSDMWGTHRWFYNGGEFFTQQPNKQNKGNHEPISILDTYGCSCHQILDLLKNAGLGEFGGHYKFGCSTSILEDFNQAVKDYNLDGQYFIETVTVPAGKVTNTFSNSNLVNTTGYLLVAKGTWTNSNNLADAEYITKDTWSTHTDGYDFDPYNLGEGAFDLIVDNNFVDWGEYNNSHEYEYNFVGTGNKLGLMIFDGYSGTKTIVPGWYTDNRGSLFVDIYGVL